MRSFIAFILALELFSMFGMDFFGLDFLYPVLLVSMLFLLVLAFEIFFANPAQANELNQPLSLLDKVCWFVILFALAFAIFRYVKIGYLLKSGFLFALSAIANFAYFIVGLFLLVIFLGLLFLVGNSSTVSNSDSVSRSDSDSTFSSTQSHYHAGYDDDDGDSD